MGRFIFVNLGLLVVAFCLRGGESHTRYEASRELTRTSSNQGLDNLQIAGSGAACPSGWSSHDKYCYNVFEERKNWDEAESFCMEQGKEGHLASLLSSKEESHVANLAFKSLKKPSLWIGLSNIWSACTWEWSDGSSLAYEGWVEAPNCVILKIMPGYVEWNGIECKSTLPFACKFLAEPKDPAPE